MLININEFIERVVNLNIENISEEVMQEVLKIIESTPEFTEEKLSKISKSGSLFFRWITNVCNYYKIIKEIKRNQPTQK